MGSGLVAGLHPPSSIGYSSWLILCVAQTKDKLLEMIMITLVED